jgi:hypothetical protein
MDLVVADRRLRKKLVLSSHRHSASIIAAWRAHCLFAEA